jgi:hypothetical protein
MGIVTRNHRLHIVLAAGAAIGFVAYVALLFAKL